MFTRNSINYLDWDNLIYDRIKYYNMSESVLEDKIKSLEERLAHLEDKYDAVNELDTISEEVLKRIKESEEWIKSGDTSKLIRIK